MNKSIITVANQKGGVGKTTTAVTLAHALAIQGVQILLIDLCPQGNAATALGVEPSGGVFNWIVKEANLKGVVRVARPGLTLLPGNKQTAMAISYLTVVHQGAVPKDLLAARLKPPLRNGLDVVIMDTSPSVSALQSAAMWAADLVLIPAKCDFYSEEAVAAALDTLEILGQADQEYIVLPTMYDQRTKESQRALGSFQSALGDRVAEPIHSATRIMEAAAAGKTVFEVEPNGRPAQEYAALTWKVRQMWEEEL